MHAPYDTTWQQWQCACCGSWNDWAADEREPNAEEHAIGRDVSLSHDNVVGVRKLDTR